MLGFWPMDGATQRSSWIAVGAQCGNRVAEDGRRPLANQQGDRRGPTPFDSPDDFQQVCCCHAADRQLPDEGEHISRQEILHLPLVVRRPARRLPGNPLVRRSEEHTSELQSLMRISYAVFCLKKKKKHLTTAY